MFANIKQNEAAIYIYGGRIYIAAVHLQFRGAGRWPFVTESG